jgi:hypothetical protein
MESDYIPTSDSDNDSISIGSSGSLDCCLLEDLTENDIADITTDILENIELYIKNEMLSMSSPNFYPNLIESVGSIIFDDWIVYGICEDSDHDTYLELLELVEQFLGVYFDFSEIPRRERGYSIDIENNNSIITISNRISYLQYIPH